MIKDCIQQLRITGTPYTVADPGFPFGGTQSVGIGGRGLLSAKMYTKMK